MLAASAAAQDEESLDGPAEVAPGDRAAMARELLFARRAVANGDTQVALALYERALRRDPGNPAILAEMLKVTAAHALTRSPAAPPPSRPQFAERTSATEPEASDVDLRAARAAERRGDRRQAMKSYERVLARDPNNREARNGMIGTLVAAAVPDSEEDDVNKLFDAIMRDPGNVELNLRYARAVIARGEPRKALPAYERVLARDPNNAEAKEGIERVRVALEPTITQYNVSTGAYYESNPRHFPRSSRETRAGTFASRASIFDERRLAGLRWRTDGEVFNTYHTKFHEIDYGVLGVRTGPVFQITENLRLNPFVGGGYAWLKARSFYTEATAGASLEFERHLPLHSIAARFGYDNIGKHISTRDALFVELGPRFVFPDTGYKGAAVWVNPYWRYSGVLGSGSPGVDQRTEPFPARSHQAGVRADYFMPITSELTIGINAGYEYRHFYEGVSDGGKNRRDHLVSPGVQAIVTGILDERFGIIASYNYEHRFSNDKLQVYSNHAAGVRFQWRN